MTELQTRAIAFVGEKLEKHDPATVLGVREIRGEFMREGK